MAAKEPLKCKEVIIGVEGFMPTAPEILVPLVSLPILEFHDILGESYNYRPAELVKWDGDHPHIQNIGHSDLIMLCADGKDYPSILYEFAHEYCHHLIGVRFGTHKGGCLWLEETLCELASQYCLTTFVRLLRHIQDSQTRQLLAAAHRLLSDSNSWNRSCHESLPAQAAALPLLERGNFFPIHKDGHKRGFYSHIASQILPIFQDNPSLWKIVGHISDSTAYASVEGLFDHLENTADDSYSCSLAMLKEKLMSRQI